MANNNDKNKFKNNGSKFKFGIGKVNVGNNGGGNAVVNNDNGKPVHKFNSKEEREQALGKIRK